MRLRERGCDVLHARDEPRERRLVDVERARGTLCVPQVHGAVHFAALQVARERLAQFALAAAQFLREAKLRFEEAMVDAAQLAGEGAPGALGLTSGEAGHARDHWMAGCYKS